MHPSNTGKYASKRRVEKLEQSIEDMQSAIESQTDIITDLRARLLPVPVDLLGPIQQSPALREAHLGT